MSKESLGVQAVYCRERIPVGSPQRMESEAVRQPEAAVEIQEGRGVSKEQSMLREIVGREQSQPDRAVSWPISKAAGVVLRLLTGPHKPHCGLTRQRFKF